MPRVSNRVAKTHTKKLAEGKTKVIYPIPADKSLVRVVHKDDITAGDGAKHDILVDKGAWACQTSSNCFLLLDAAGIPTHFVAHT